MHIADRTRTALGWDEILAALAQRTRTPPGHARALARPFLADRDAVLGELSLVAEARLLLQEPLRLPLSTVTDVRPLLEKAERGALLEPMELRAVTHCLFAFEHSLDALAQRRDRVPGLHRLGGGLPDLGALATRLDRAIEPSGEISDRASPELREARERVRALHRTIKTRLDKLLHEPAFTMHLRESYFSVRNERYVVPVLAQAQAEVPGIVHNASQSGQTLFVEPQELIGVGNQLAIAQSLVLEEERRVLLELAGQVGREAAAIARGVDVAARLDELEAAAALAEALDATAPELQPAGGALLLKGLRHPRLLLGGVAVVANDVELRDAARALVVSGPNAGGKTVTLTGVGLCALLLRAGLPVPADPGSTLPLFDSVHAAVGDAQDLAQGLSTFSAHVAQLRDVVAQADQGALVLVDEIAADTDPREGAALAIAVLEDLLAKGALVLVTTHLEELKALAHLDPRFVNARVGFDPRAMAPTYRLQLGAAGASSAIEIARRTGLPAALCDRAVALAQNQGGALAKALTAAEDERRRYLEAKDALGQQDAELQRTRVELERARAELDERRLRDEVRFREALAAELEYARGEVRGLLDALKKEKDARKVERAARELFERAQEQSEGARAAKAALAGPPAAPQPQPGFQPRPGGRAWHLKLGRDVEVLELDASEAVVAAGPLRMRVPLAELAPPRQGAPARTAGPSPTVAERAAAAAGGPITRAHTLDLRGQRAEDALRELELFLDRLVREGAEQALVIHGHGTGALKKQVREYLAGSPYAKGHQPGGAGEGGDGATVVLLG